MWSRKRLNAVDFLLNLKLHREMLTIAQTRMLLSFGDHLEYYIMVCM